MNEKEKEKNKQNSVITVKELICTDSDAQKMRKKFYKKNYYKIV